MNEYTGPELEGEEVALIDMLRGAEGPTLAQEDRMLARLRAHIEIEAEVHGAADDSFDPEADAGAKRVSPPAPWRSAAVGVVAFAAGVALTWGLRDDSQPSARPPAEVVVRGDSPHPAVRPVGSVGEALVGRAPPQVVAPATRSAHAGGADPLFPAPARIDRAEQGAERTPPQHGGLAEASITPGNDEAMEPRETHSGNGPAREGTRGGAEEPRSRAPATARQPQSTAPAPPPAAAVTPTPFSVGPVELVGGAPSTMGRPYAPSAGGAAPAPRPSASEPAPDRPSPEPEPPPAEGPPEPPEPEDEEPPEPEDACNMGHMMCTESAELMCLYNGDDCGRFFEFCDFSLEVCLGDGEPPPDYEPDNDEPPPPEPDHCVEQFELCMAELEATCNHEGELPPEECMDFEWRCLDEQAACAGYEPPPPPSEW